MNVYLTKEGKILVEEEIPKGKNGRTIKKIFQSQKKKNGSRNNPHRAQKAQKNKSEKVMGFQDMASTQESCKHGTSKSR